jgi:hypothetical protein
MGVYAFMLESLDTEIENDSIWFRNNWIT